MKEQLLKKLVSLAKLYRNYYTGILNNSNHNYIQTDKLKIDVYFNDSYNTCSVYFGNVEISLYANKISIPLNVTESYLEKTYSNAVSFFQEDKKRRKIESNSEKEARRIEKINALKSELERLEKA